MNYTKGKWVVYENRINDYVIQVIEKKQAYPVARAGTERDALLISAAPEMYEALKENQKWLNNFVMKFYIEAEKPTYENMKKLYQELDEYARKVGNNALAKAEGR